MIDLLEPADSLRRIATWLAADVEEWANRVRVERPSDRTTDAQAGPHTRDYKFDLSAQNIRGGTLGNYSGAEP